MFDISLGIQSPSLLLVSVCFWHKADIQNVSILLLSLFSLLIIGMP